MPCYVCITNIEVLKTIIALATAIVGLFVFGFGIYQYREAQKWKRLEFLSKEIKEFLADDVVKNMQKILDWSEAGIKINDKAYSVNESFLIDAFYPDDYGKSGLGYSPEQQEIRIFFDIFFDKLKIFAQYEASGLISFHEINIYLKYWFRLLGDKNAKEWRNPELLEQIWKYLERYDYSEILGLLKKAGYKITE